jgi:hypothetical protein
VRDIGKAALARRGANRHCPAMVGQFPASTLQALPDNPLGQGEFVLRPDVVQMTDRDVVLRRDASGVELRIGQMILDIPGEPQGQAAVLFFLSGLAGSCRGEERAHQFRARLADHGPRGARPKPVRCFAQPREMSFHQAVDGATGQPGPGRPRRAGGYSQPVIVDDKGERTADAGPAAVEVGGLI